MKKCLFSLFALSVILTSCVSEQLVIARFKKDCKELKTDSILYTTSKFDHNEVSIISSKVTDITYFINIDNQITATLHMENGQTLDISVANGMLNDANLVGRKISWTEKSPVYRKDTVYVKIFDTVYVSNLVCQKKTVKKNNYIIKVYDYVTEGRYRLTTDKATFEALVAVPPFAYITDQYGSIRWRSNARYCIPWEKALKLKGNKNMEIKISPTIYDYKILEQK
jgi:hypothetical protein